MKLESLKFIRDGPFDRGILIFVISNLPPISDIGFHLELENVKLTIHGRCKASLRYVQGKGWHAKVESSDDLPMGFRSHRICCFLNDYLRKNFPIDTEIGSDTIVRHAIA